MQKNFIIAFVFAVLAALFISLYLYDIEQKNRKMSEPVKVIVANTKIEQGSIIDSSMLKEKLVPKEYAQPQYISSIEAFYDNDKPSCIAIVSFEQGEQITSTKILSANSDSGISNSIPSGNRAITLIFNSDEVLGIIKPGSRVDLISVMEYESKNQTFVEASCVIAQNLLVLAVDNEVIGRTDTKQENVSVTVPVTMAVSLKEAQIIFFAQEKSSLKIVLRPTADLNIENTNPVKMQDIVHDASQKITKHETIDNKTLKQMQQNQKEALEILSKYSK
ncbi:Flp pilus assembly protein CpaB [Candidatus Ruminimicrobium bovinum]|uniref:Flp pilus assembly protein CpaB n=1 Tax=Candidatus Ruminimicrobium bovinum TaxID=3242779 RepID=UPI0039B830C3